MARLVKTPKDNVFGYFLFRNTGLHEYEYLIDSVHAGDDFEFSSDRSSAFVFDSEDAMNDVKKTLEELYNIKMNEAELMVRVV